MPRKDKVIHISNLPSTFRGNVTRNGKFIQMVFLHLAEFMIKLLNLLV